MENQLWKKPRILCLHGHGASAKILQEEMKRWPEFVLEMMDLVYIDAPFSVNQSGLEGKFDPPSYEWYKDYEHNKNFDESIAYIEKQMIKRGPFDGVLGVSQGGIITAALPGMQRESFVHPTVLYHQVGHGIPHLDNNGVKIILGFLNQIQRIILYEKDNIQSSRSRMCCFYLDSIASLFYLRWKRRIKMHRARVQSLSLPIPHISSKKKPKNANLTR